MYVYLSLSLFLLPRGPRLDGSLNLNGLLLMFSGVGVHGEEEEEVVPLGSGTARPRLQSAGHDETEELPRFAERI